MDKSKFLSGEELIARGVTRSNVSLPELGVKDVLPNGSWLEQKQIESALEARKHLIEVPRIEKSGNISQASWREDLMLAEVTKQVGPHWQYLGHNIGKHLYLKPEEALYLMEVNCLLLKYNEVTVSMQQAYALLLRGKVTPLKYQVYSSLSRVGYKVFQHEYKAPELGTDNAESEIKTKADTLDITEVKSIEARMDTAEVRDKENNEEFNKRGVNLNREDLGEQMDVQDETEKVLDNSIKDGATQSTKEETMSNETQMDTNSENIKGETNSEQTEKLHEVIISQTQPENAQSENTELVQGNENVANDNDVISMSNLEKERENNKDAEIVKQCDASQNDNNLQNTSILELSQDRTTTENDKQHDGSKNECLTKENHTEQFREKEKSEIETVNGNETDKLDVIDVDEPTRNVGERETDNNDLVIIDSSNNIDIDKSGIIEIDSESDNINENVPKSKTSNDVNITEPKVDVNEKKIIERKLHCLQKRKIRPSSPSTLHKAFDIVPNFYQNDKVTINVPKEELIPKNVFCNNTRYVLVTEKIRNETKESRRSSVETRSYSESDEVNGAHVRRVRASTEANSQPVSLPTSVVQQTEQRYFRNHQFRQPHFWRPRFHFPANFMYPRINFSSNVFPRFNFNPRYPFWRPPFNPAFNANPYNTAGNNAFKNLRKRNRKSKNSHLDAIKRLAQRLKAMVLAGSTSLENIEALQSLIQTYNIRYKTNIKLSNEFEVMDGEIILETIELDDEEEPQNKRQKIEKKTQKYEENFNGLKKLAAKLKEMADKNVISSRHRRAFSNVLKEFNKTYDAEVYVDANYQVIDKRYVTLDSSSESDCVVEETPPSGKLLRNPFNILKQLSKTPTCTVNRLPTPNKNVDIAIDNKNNSKKLENIFDNNWLPKEDDFGRAEVVPRSLMHIMFIDSKKEEYLYDFIKNQHYDFDNWLDLKLAFFSSFDESVQYDVSLIEEDNCDIKPILSQDDRLDMPGILKKLSIIKSNSELATESSLSVDFDVYNRDVQNFKKTKPPKPHFRVVCLSDKSPFPTNGDVAALHAKYSDNVTIIFAIVADGSVSYLQMNPIELPVYTPTSDMDFT